MATKNTDATTDTQDMVSFEEAANYLDQSGTTVSLNEYKLIGKTELVKVPFVLQDWKVVVDKATDREYVNVKILAKGFGRVCFNDGGSGIRPKLEDLEATTGRRDRLVCEGLQVSEYPTTDAKGNSITGRTWYLR